MKKFTDTQKKWALTATMIAALGCSVSFNPHTNGYAALDFASTSSDVVTKKLKLDDQVLKVHYIPTGKKTTAVVTGGSDCVVCNTYVIDKKLKDDADTLTDIQVELVQQIAAKQDGEEVEESADDDRSERDEELEEARKERKEKIAEARKEKKKAKEDYKEIARRMKLADCGDDEMNFGMDRATCLSTELLSILDSKKQYSSTAVFEYFSNEVQPKILEQLLDPSTVNPNNPYSPKVADRALNAIKSLMKGLPSAYNTTRESVVYLGAQSIHASAALQQEYLSKFAATGSSEAKLYATAQQGWTTSLADNLKNIISTSAIMGGLAKGTISQSQANRIFQNNYELYANAVQAGTSLWTVKGQPINFGAYSLPEPKYANVLGMPDMQPGVVQAEQGPDLSSRILVIERGSNNNGAIPMLQSNTSNIQFGTPNQIDPRVQQQLMELRASQIYHRAQ